MQIDFCIKAQKSPKVTYWKELCKPCLDLLKGRLYAKHTTSHSVEGINASPNLHKTIIII